MEWLEEILNIIIHEETKFNSSNNNLKVNFFITGEGIYSLADKRYDKIWSEILVNKQVNCSVDAWELSLTGINEIPLSFKFPEQFNTKTNIMSNPILFWDEFINVVNDFNHKKRLGFLELRGPYMSRTSVYLIRLLRASINNGISPELYAYLDGIHLGHDGQHPSAFENIAEDLQDIINASENKNLKPLMIACSRCATARGYVKKELTEECIQSHDYISGFLICNLNRIIDQFELDHLIFSPNSIIITNVTNDESKMYEASGKPSIIIFMTHGPYGTEWTFGGLSFAMACANHDISTTVIFIEDGAYCLLGVHDVNDKEGIFNIQEIIEATADMENLSYYAHETSLLKRGILISDYLESVSLISNKSLAHLFFNFSNSKFLLFKRVIFF